MHINFRKSVLGGAAAITALALTLTACSSSDPEATASSDAPGATSSGGASESGLVSGPALVWAIEDASVNAINEDAITTFNDATGSTVKLETFANDPYKEKLRTGIGSDNQPDIFYNWGGGNLKQYSDAGHVADLTSWLDENPDFRDQFLPSVLGVGTVDGKVYGLPMQGVLPVVMYANKDVLAAAGIDAMATTWDELLSQITKLKVSGVQPIALAGNQAWTELMWLEYLLDRVGGPEKFQAIVNGDEGAWTDPAVIESLSMIQDLVNAGAFGTNYASVGYDDQGTIALMASGKVGYDLMGAWHIGALKGNGFEEFADSGSLEWGPFVSISGGVGDPNNIVGNPSNYYSVTESSPNQEVAQEFLLDTLTSESYVDALLEIGQVPAVAGIEDKLTDPFNKFTYNLVGNAPAFTQSWDQALDPATSEAMLTNLQKVFLLDMTPEEFGQAMDAV
ncbi:extracellular solute-binding protein [Demequina aurantiaca]|uniref:extracellular solute-binding protein n=1 Tax=Demequina aurantiaca TaxID=676200 RepID=UPI0007861574|nr:extracellular solute-binding protein [Demequina aurantiaca]